MEKKKSTNAEALTSWTKVTKNENNVSAKSTGAGSPSQTEYQHKRPIEFYQAWIYNGA